jgi:hypothetical protein
MVKSALVKPSFSPVPAAVNMAVVSQGQRKNGKQMSEEYDAYGHQKCRRVKYTQSKFFHRYFEGYSEVLIEREGKPGRIQRVYTAPWYMLQSSDRRWMFRRFIYGVLVLFSTAVFIFAMTRPVASNLSWHISLIGLPASICCFLSVVAVMLYICTPRGMTIYEKKSSSKFLKNIALVASITYILTACATAVYLILQIKKPEYLEITNIALEMIAAIALFVVYNLEATAVYITVENTNKIPPGGIQIK